MSVTVCTGGNDFSHWLNEGDKVPYVTRKWGKGYRDLYDWVALHENGVRLITGQIVPYKNIVSYTLS